MVRFLCAVPGHGIEGARTQGTAKRPSQENAKPRPMGVLDIGPVTKFRGRRVFESMTSAAV